MNDRQFFDMLLEMNEFFVSHSDVVLVLNDLPRQQAFRVTAHQMFDKVSDSLAEWVLPLKEIKTLSLGLRELFCTLPVRMSLISKLQFKKYTLEELEDLFDYVLTIEAVDHEWIRIGRELMQERAEKKARQLLDQFLNKQQRLCLRLNGYFVVDGTRARYRLGKQSVILNSDNKSTHSFCIHFKTGGLPYSDHLLALKLLLETDESKFWDIAHVREIETMVV